MCAVTVTRNNVNIYAPTRECIKADIKVKADLALHGNPISELRDVTCHIGSRSVTCQPTQVNAPRLTPAIQPYSIYLPLRDGRLS